METLIENPAALHSLANRRARRGIERVRLTLPGTEEDLRRAERTINRGLHACGCETGAMFLAAGAVLLAGQALIDPGQIQWTSAATWWRAGLVLITSALLGKAAGLAWAEWRLRTAINRFPKPTDT